MKKLGVLLVCMLVMVSFVNAQYLTDIDGWTWTKYPNETKTGIIMGYLIAMSTLYEFSVDGYNITEKQGRSSDSILKMQMFDAIKDWADYGGSTVGNIITKVNEYYAYSSDNKKAKLYLIIPWLYDKEWW